MIKQVKFVSILVAICLLLLPTAGSAAPLKGLLVYDSIYGSTIEVAYWIKAIVGIGAAARC
jgi:hypothetical protein